MANITEFTSYRNKRFSRGNKVSLLFNPKLTFKATLDRIDKLPINRDYIAFDGDVLGIENHGLPITCGEFGGILDIANGVDDYCRYDRAYFSGTGLTVTFDYPENPVDKSFNTMLLQEDQTSTSHYRYTQSSTDAVVEIGKVYTLSCFVRDVGSIETRYIHLRGDTATFNYDKAAVVFDIIDGVAVKVGDNVVDYGVEDYGDGWYKVSMSIVCIRTADSTANARILYTHLLYEDGIYKTGYTGILGRETQVYNFTLTEGVKTYFPERKTNIISTTTYTKSNNIMLSKDTFPVDSTNWLDTDAKEFNVFSDLEHNRIDNLFIESKQVTTQQANYGYYPIGYNSNDLHFITINVTEKDFDKVKQLAMSRAIAVVSCDNSLEEANTVMDGIEIKKPLGGGSFNPLIRQAYFVSSELVNNRNRNTYNIKLMLLG